MDLISIIVPIYNCDKYLKRCLDSIINQTYNNIEIILVNDGSIDKSKEICENYKKRDKRIKVLNIKNSGVSNARNIGINIAEGKYLGFVDADDWIENTMFEDLYKNMQKYKANISICEKIIEKDYLDDNNIENLNKKEITKMTIDIQELSKRESINNIFKDCQKCYGGYVFNKLFEREFIIEEKILFNNKIKICEDVLFVFDYMSKFKNLKTIYNKKIYYHYTERKNSALREKFNENKITEIDAYEEILSIISKCPELEQEVKINVSNIKRLYIKTNNKIYVQIKKNNIKNQELIKKLFKNSKKYYSDVLKCDDIAFCYKVDLIISTRFPLIYDRIRNKAV